MATRGNRPRDPAATKGGVRGTHGLGDAPRESDELHPVAAQGGTASRTGGSTRGGTASRSHLGMRSEAPQKGGVKGENENVSDESVGEEREFELSNAMADLETADERAERREREANEARESERRAAEEEILGDARFDEEERRDRNLDTVKTHGPGPKDAGKGTALKKHLDEHGIERR